MNLHEYFIHCDNSQEILKCALFLVDSGYNVYNWNYDLNKFNEFAGSIIVWVGYTSFDGGFIRSGVGDHSNLKHINFKVLQRKTKLLKIEQIWKK